MSIICSSCGKKADEPESSTFVESWGTSEEGSPVKIYRCQECNAEHEGHLEQVALNNSAEERRQEEIERLLVLTTDFVPNIEIKEALGTARGGTVRAKNIGRDIAAGLKNIVGGEIKGYTELLAEGREEAIYRMKTDAFKMGANAILNVRFTSSMIDVGAVEIVSYGTAVIVANDG